MNSTQHSPEVPAILPSSNGEYLFCPTVMTEDELIQFLRIPEISSATNYTHVIENLKRNHGLPRIHLCGRTVYLIDSVECVGDIDLQDVRYGHDERFIQYCLTQNLTAGTTTKKVKPLKRVFQLAEDRGQLDRHPLRRLKPVIGIENRPTSASRRAHPPSPAVVDPELEFLPDAFRWVHLRADYQTEIGTHAPSA